MGISYKGPTNHRMGIANTTFRVTPHLPVVLCQSSLAGRSQMQAQPLPRGRLLGDGLASVGTKTGDGPFLQEGV